MAKTMDQHKRQIEELPTSGREDGMHEANVHRHRSRKKPRTAPMNGAPENLLDLSSPGRRPRNLPPRETAPLRALNDASHSSTLDAAATIPMSATASPTNEEDTRESLESREKLAINLLCRMSLPQNKESWAPLDEPLDSPPHPPVTLCPRPQPLELAPTLHPTTEPMHDNQDRFQLAPLIPKPSWGLKQRLQTPEKLAVSTLCSMAPPKQEQTRRKDEKPPLDATEQTSDTESAPPPPKKKMKRRRDLSKPTLDSLVRDRFGGDVFAFLSRVEEEMQRHNFTATGLARKFDAVNCQSRFRTIVAELKGEPIVGMSKLWRERCRAYLRATRNQDAETHADEQSGKAKRAAPKARSGKRDAITQGSSARATVVIPAPQKDKHAQHPMQENHKANLDTLVHEYFHGNIFHFFEYLEKEMNQKNFSATGLARKFGVVHCQSRFRTIIAELKGEPIVGMSRLWKERVQSYLRSKKSQKTVKDDEPAMQDTEQKEEPPQLVQDCSNQTPGTPGTVGMFVQENFASDYYRFFETLQEEMEVPGFSVDLYARQHGITEGRKVLANIAAELNGLPDTSLTQAWRDRVKEYLESTKAE